MVTFILILSFAAFFFLPLGYLWIALHKNKNQKDKGGFQVWKYKYYILTIYLIVMLIAIFLTIKYV